MEPLRNDRPTALRVGVLILTSTLVLTAGFIGILAFITGEVTAFASRLPVYLLLSAVVFVAATVLLDDDAAPGTQVIATTLSVSVVSFVLATLSGEGLRYAAANPGELLSSQMLFYFLAAGLFCTGVGYWSVNHWREFAGETDRRDLSR